MLAAQKDLCIIPWIEFNSLLLCLDAFHFYYVGLYIQLNCIGCSSIRFIQSTAHTYWDKYVLSYIYVNCFSSQICKAKIFRTLCTTTHVATSRARRIILIWTAVLYGLNLVSQHRANTERENEIAARRSIIEWIWKLPFYIHFQRHKRVNMAKVLL